MVSSPRAATDQTERESDDTAKKDHHPGGEYDNVSHAITEAIELPVKIKASRRGGRVEIRFHHRDDLDAIVSLLTQK